MNQNVHIRDSAMLRELLERLEALSCFHCSPTEPAALLQKCAPAGQDCHCHCDTATAGQVPCSHVVTA